MTADEIKQGIAICEKATRSEWFVGHLGRDDHKCDCRYIFDENHMGAIAEVCVEDGENDCPPKEEAVANMDLIAFFGTHGLALLRELEKERARNEELVRVGRAMLRAQDFYVHSHTPDTYDALVLAARAFDALLAPQPEERKETT